MWTEYLNRLLGVTVGLLILATLVSAWRHHRQTPRIIWPTLAAFLLVGFQGWLGGVVVQQELASWIVTLHMLVALIIVSLLLYATVYAFFPSATARAYRERRWLTVSGAVLIAITLVQITVGTQVREHIDTAIDRGVPRDQALATAGNYDWWHRDLAAVVLVVTLWMLAITLSHHRAESAIVRTAGIVIVLVGVQVVFGVAMAYGGLIAPAQIAHLTVASLLLGAETVLVLLARWSPVRNS
jgi:cytochrome c oxidase assembly protein subunit 15